MPDVNDLLGFAIDKNPVDFADTVNAMLQQKAAAAVEDRRVELAQSLYAEPEDNDDVGEDEFDFSDDDLDGADEDIDDLDLDDLDLDDLDLDLEGIADDEDA